MNISHDHVCHSHHCLKRNVALCSVGSFLDVKFFYALYDCFHFLMKYDLRASVHLLITTAGCNVLPVVY